MQRRTIVLAIGMLLICAATASAAARDYAGTALNILPSGQYGSVPAPPEADELALMYYGLTPLVDKVKTSDKTNVFKSERFGVGPDGPATVESVPYPGVTVLRDRFNVPHVTSKSYAGGIFTAGYIAAEDRGLLLQQARFNARVASIDAPGLTAIGLITQLKNFVPSAQTEAVVARQTKVLQKSGKEGRAVLRDIDTFISGINAFFAQSGSPAPPFTRNDIFAVNALKSQFLGQGGGDEARRSQFLGGLRKRLGPKRGMTVFSDLSQRTNPGSVTSIDGSFPYAGVPKRASGSVILDPGSFRATPSASTRAGGARVSPSQSPASNVLLIDGERSATGKPLMVGGPQIGYFYPGLTYEIDMHAPGLNWRGATSLPFPGYLLIGRGEDFATTLTSASGDIVDQYAETLCGGSATMYLYKGKCREMGTFNAGTLSGEPVTFRTTVHGPVEGYATVKGRRVAISSKRSSRGRETLDLRFNRRLSTGAVKSPKTFFKAAAMTPQTFNSFYIDNEHIAEFTSGLLPLRHPRVDPRLPTIGTGNFEWRGFLATKGHPQDVDPRDGTIVNWNNGVARGFAAADDDFGRNGSAQRNDLLTYNLDRLKRKGKWTLATVTSAMNAGATQDVRAIVTVPLLARLLKGTKPSTPQAGKMLDVLVSWRRNGGSRLDRDLDGLIDHPGAAIIDTAWTGIADATLRPVLGSQLDELATLFPRFDQPPSGQFSGWYQYFDRDIRRLLFGETRDPFQNQFCGAGKLGACQRAIWKAIGDAGVKLSNSQGTTNPSAWRADATKERIKFVPGLLPTTLRYTNRPTGIQQVISFDGHR